MKRSVHSCMSSDALPPCHSQGEQPIHTHIWQSGLLFSAYNSPRQWWRLLPTDGIFTRTLPPGSEVKKVSILFGQLPSILVYDTWWWWFGRFLTWKFVSAGCDLLPESYQVGSQISECLDTDGTWVCGDEKSNSSHQWVPVHHNRRHTFSHHLDCLLTRATWWTTDNIVHQSCQCGKIKCNVCGYKRGFQVRSYLMSSFVLRALQQNLLSLPTYSDIYANCCRCI